MAPISGTTLAGVKQPDFVVLGSDTKATYDKRVVRFNHKKIYKYYDDFYAMACGHSDDFPVALAQVTSFHEKFLNNTLKVVQSTLDLYNPGARWGLMIGGFASGVEGNGVKSPFLESVDPNPQSKCSRGKGFYAMGSGGEYAAKILSKMPITRKLSKEEVVEWVERALVYGALYDPASGGGYFIQVIEREKTYEDKGDWILKKLWDKHAVYFKENFDCKFGELPKHIKHAWIEGWDLSDKGWEEQWNDERSRYKN